MERGGHIFGICHHCNGHKKFEMDEFGERFCETCGWKYDPKANREKLIEQREAPAESSWAAGLGCAVFGIGILAIILITLGLPAFIIKYFLVTKNLNIAGIAISLVFGYICAGFLQYNMERGASPRNQSRAVREGKIAICILYWPDMVVQNRAIMPDLISLRLYKEMFGTHNTWLYRFFLYFLVSVPQWGICSSFFLFVGIVIKTYNISWLATLGLLLWPIIPVLNIFFIIPASILSTIAWLVWLPVLKLFLPKP